MELTDNDKHRIEQASLLYSGNHNLSSHLFNGFIKGAEYATIYEREQQAIPKPCHFCGGNGFIMGYENSSRECKYCNGSGQITENIECLSLPECYAASKKLEQLEAERSELTKEIERLNNVYDEMDTERQFKDVNLEQLHKLLTEAYQHISYNASNNLHYRIKETLNSLKTK